MRRKVLAFLFGIGLLGAIPCSGFAEEVHQHPSQKKMETKSGSSTGCCCCSTHCCMKMIDKSSMHDHSNMCRDEVSHGSSNPIDSVGRCIQN